MCGCGRVGAVFLACSRLVPELGGFGLGQGGPQGRPDLRFLERDVVPGGLDELAEQPVELWVVRVELVQLGEYFFAFLLLADGLVGELVAVRQCFRTAGQKYISSTASCLDSSMTSVSAIFLRAARRLSLTPDAAGAASNWESSRLTCS